MRASLTFSLSLKNTVINKANELLGLFVDHRGTSINQAHVEPCTWPLSVRTWAMQHRFGPPNQSNRLNVSNKYREGLPNTF